jgi:hypothetical protein
VAFRESHKEEERISTITRNKIYFSFVIFSFSSCLKPCESPLLTKPMPISVCPPGCPIDDDYLWVGRFLIIIISRINKLFSL